MVGMDYVSCSPFRFRSRVSPPRTLRSRIRGRSSKPHLTIHGPRSGAGRFLMRPPISLERMAWDGAREVRYRRTRVHEGSGLSEREVGAFDPAEFLARVGVGADA